MLNVPLLKIEKSNLSQPTLKSYQILTDEFLISILAVVPTKSKAK